MQRQLIAFVVASPSDVLVSTRWSKSGLRRDAPVRHERVLHRAVILCGSIGPRHLREPSTEATSIETSASLFANASTNGPAAAEFASGNACSLPRRRSRSAIRVSRDRVAALAAGERDHRNGTFSAPRAGRGRGPRSRRVPRAIPFRTDRPSAAHGHGERCRILDRPLHAVPRSGPTYRCCRHHPRSALPRPPRCRD